MWLRKYLETSSYVSGYRSQELVYAHISPVQEALLIIGSLYQAKSPLFVVKETEAKAQELIDIITSLDASLRVIFYNQEESLRVEAIAQSEIMKADRLQALYHLLVGDYDICITHAAASIRKISPRSVLEENMIHLSLGEEYDPQKLIEKLQRMGYSRVKYVDKPFTYARRGGIIDVFSVQEEKPLRIEFFDDEVDSLRTFDIESQRSLETKDQALILFAQELILSDADSKRIEEKTQEKLRHETSQNRIQNTHLLLESVANHYYEPALLPLLAYAQELVTIYDYMDDLAYLSPVEAVKRHIRQFVEDSLSFYEEQYDMEEGLYIPDSFKDALAFTDKESLGKIYEFNDPKAVVLPWHSLDTAFLGQVVLLQQISQEAKEMRVILSLNEKDMETVIEELVEQKIHYTLFSGQTEKGLYLEMSDLGLGFVLEDINTRVYSSQELLRGQKRLYRYENKFSQAEVLYELQDLKVNDYIVHRQYGIGQYLGILTKEVEGIHKDFMRIMYRDGDELFVPIDQVSLVRKYRSSEAVAVRLSKLGSAAWQRSKDKVREDVKDIADELIQLYSQRMASKGFAFSKDNKEQKEFEEAFPYRLTPDQDTAIKEIKEDMEKDLPMDRLLCGDVGFGKTEVAIRAAFKAVMDNKQVIFLCPTTILSAQHYRTFMDRFKDYPVNIELMNRFVPEKKQRSIMKRVKEGKVDILIGTHRVLSDDMKFKDLGLLVIDEEQRFGVEHKEKIKAMKVSLDVLSLSATPIPRTLQMSLIGIRSLSQLNTPPSNRLPVMTYVIEKNQETIYDIIRKELARKGQVFYLYNNIDQIYSVASQLALKVEGAKTAVIHGQMDRYEIEDVMIAFINREYNVLVCTTIIETGIDIPNVNTILVEDAHRFGLSQLYQIKGRVGRSDRLAYAYFLVPAKKSLTEIATKRLQAIKEFTQLGSGYKIAMRDLTIRGAGELLGGNQSGFIDTVGIDLYIDLLKEALALRQGETIEKKTNEDMITVNIDGYLPEQFTDDDGEKLDLYQEINAIQSLTKLRDFTLMLKDRYGHLPGAVAMLMEKKRLELLLNDKRIQSFKERAKRIDLSFTPEFSERVDGVALFATVSKLSPEIKLKYVDRRITISLAYYPDWPEDLMTILENIKERSDEA